MIIGLTGLKGSGKDTAALYFIENESYRKLAFADKLKEAVAHLFNLNIERVDEFKSDSEIPLAEVILEFGTTQWSWSWREFLQRFGTEMARNTFGEWFWIDQWDKAYHEIQTASSAYIPVVVTDVRFENEAQWIRDLGGKVIEIRRAGLTSDGHASELGIEADHVIENNGTIPELHHKLRLWYHGL